MTHPTHGPGDAWPTDPRPAQGVDPVPESAVATPPEPVLGAGEGLGGTASTSSSTTGITGSGSTTGSGSDGGGRADEAKHQASEVKDTAASAAQDVAGTAKEQARNVVGEIGDRSRELLSRSGSELSDQAGRQQQRLAGGISGYADELRQLASGNATSGTVSDLAHQLAERGERASDWLSRSEPRDVLHAVEDFARRRPVVFLAAAAGAGVLAGRFARGLFADSRGGDPVLESGRHSANGGTGPDLGTSRPSASLEEVPTSGTGAGPTYDDPLAAPGVDPVAPQVVPGAAAPVYGPAGTVPGGTAPGGTAGVDPVRNEPRR